MIGLEGLINFIIGFIVGYYLVHLIKIIKQKCQKKKKIAKKNLMIF